MQQSEYCEECQRTDDSEHYVVCQSCADKAAGYDIVRIERDEMYKLLCTLNKELLEVSTQLAQTANPELGSVLAQVEMLRGWMSTAVIQYGPRGQKGSGQ